MTRHHRPPRRFARLGTAAALALLSAVGAGTLLAAAAAATAAAPWAPTGTAAAAAVPEDPGPLGFYDTRADGSPRPVRNDLTGALGATVQLAQSHTIDPAGNTARNMPTLVAERAALLLVTPTSAVSSLTVAVSVDGRPRTTLPLAPPSAVPRDDVTDTEGRRDVVYSNRAWTVELPWDAVVPGLSLAFTADGGRTGTLPAASIQVAAPTELVVNGTELGMLTDPPTGSGHVMLDDTVRAATDYFQTIPVSRLVVARYEPVRLDRVMVASGTIYTSPGTSATTGDVYSGDLRENVGKAQFSTGVNLAGFGIPSAPMTQNQPGTFNQRVYHHSAGAYINGRVVHGLSGGNGMATLYDSVGNEWSHEIGHSFGLGHYPGVDDTKTGDERVINATHHSESGWGYIAYRDRMRSNLVNNQAFVPGGIDVAGTPFRQSFAGLYNYQRDAMSGGFPTSDLSRYTHHTGYSATRIQQSLRTVVPDPAYPSGYRDWDPATGDRVDARVRDASFTAAKPRKVGVPVMTVLGAYDPANPARTALFPAMRSNYGNVFSLPAPDTGATGPARQCWVEVTYVGGRVENVSIDASDGVKQVNLNLEEAADPSRARILCRVNGTTTAHGAVSLPTDLAPLAPAVVVGQEAGYEALRAVEVRELDAALAPLAGQTAPVLDARTRLLLTSWADDLSGLGTTARQVADRALAVQAGVTRVESYVAERRAALLGGDAAAKDGLAALVRSTGLAESATALLPTPARVTVDGGRCLDVDLAATAPRVLVTAAPADCDTSAEQTWFLDARGAIHSGARPDLCLVARTPATLAPCERDAVRQEWTYEADGHLASRGQPGQYLDHYRAQGTPGLWGRAAAANQLWAGLPRSTSAGVALLSPGTLATVFAAQQLHGVSSLPLQRADNGWGPVERDRSNGEAAAGDGGVLTVAGATSPVGLGVHAASEVEVRVGGACTRLTGSVGVDAESGTRGSVVATVLADGVARWTSPTLRGGAAASSFDVDVTGATVVTLRAGTAGDGDAWDHADLLAPTLRCATAPR